MDERHLVGGAEPGMKHCDPEWPLPDTVLAPGFPSGHLRNAACETQGCPTQTDDNTTLLFVFPGLLLPTTRSAVSHASSVKIPGFL